MVQAAAGAVIVMGTSAGGVATAEVKRSPGVNPSSVTAPNRRDSCHARCHTHTHTAHAHSCIMLVTVSFHCVTNSVTDAPVVVVGLVEGDDVHEARGVGHVRADLLCCYMTV
jgi:hypothetical protein